MASMCVLNLIEINVCLIGKMAPKNPVQSLITIKLRIYNLVLHIYLSTKLHMDWPLASMCFITSQFDDVMMSHHFGFKGLLSH